MAKLYVYIYIYINTHPHFYIHTYIYVYTLTHMPWQVGWINLVTFNIVYFVVN